PSPASGGGRERGRGGPPFPARGGGSWQALQLGPPPPQAGEGWGGGLREGRDDVAQSNGGSKGLGREYWSWFGFWAEFVVLGLLAIVGTFFASQGGRPG